VGPAAPPDRLRGPQQQQRPDVEPAGVVRGGHRLELLAVAGVAEPRPRTVHGEPGQVVDLVLEPPVATVDRAGPVADPLHLAAVERVARLRQGQPEAHPQPGLLQRLPDGRDHPLLTRVELALGPGPVVVPGPVDQGDLEAAPAHPPGHDAGGPDRRRAPRLRPQAPGPPQRRRPGRRRAASVWMSSAGRSASGRPSSSRWCRVHRPPAPRCQEATLSDMARSTSLLSILTWAGSETGTSAAPRRSRLRCIMSAEPM